MFQNINESSINANEFTKREGKEKRKINLFSNVLSIRYVLIYIVSFMISMVGINNEFAPFGISVLMAGIGNAIPILGILVTSLVGSLIRFGVDGLLNYLLMALVSIVSVFLFKPRYNEEEKNEKIKLSKNVFISTLIVRNCKNRNDRLYSLWYII